MQSIREQVEASLALADFNGEQGDSLGAAYRLGEAAGLGRCARVQESFQDVLAWHRAGAKKCVLWRDQALYIGRQVRGRGWLFELVAGVGSGELVGRIRDGVAYDSADELLGVVMYLPRDLEVVLSAARQEVTGAIPQVATANV